MIPKIIHYCWFGGRPLPALAVNCIQSWKKFFPDYEIKEWNETNFDVNAIAYTREAYSVKKYAFVSDYARFWILYNYGGLYFDVDVEVIKPMDHIIHKGAFMGFENNGMSGAHYDWAFLGVNPGLGLGVEPGTALYKEIIDYYRTESFFTDDKKLNLTTVVVRVTNLLVAKGLVQNNQMQVVEGITIYPYDYFCPIRTTDGKKSITEHTVSIHHYAASWNTPMHRILRKIVLWLGGAKLKIWLSRLLKK